ncbi:hypothetical protein [Bacillus cereus group sp. BfR-BA-01380]|uniref:hypothetical protein n=1 Tax=Bacillus cereus group sp. BfR-BA-01380 TaxID=2920324 RepID=UPI001F5794E1|nr:hypothetical protein [Bacillus cereus group sp. BfR-BA-01380]
MFISILETIYESSVLLLVICSFFYYIHLRKMKRERKLSSFEFTMYTITQFAYILWAGSSLLKILSK